jgi:hypothetical protein
MPAAEFALVQLDTFFAAQFSLDPRAGGGDAKN